MSEQTCARSAELDQIYVTRQPEEIARGAQDIGLILASLAIQFAHVERVPRYTPEKRENNAEHSFMLALVATEIAAQYFPELDKGLVSQFSIIHDLTELVTGDVATFGISDEALAQKTAAEHQALDGLCALLPRHTALLLQVYEEQLEPEARFVRLVDKHMPLLVDILGPGSKVMHEDYDTCTLDDLRSTERKMKSRFETMFPDAALTPLHIARHSLARQFEDVFEPLRYIQDRLF